MAAWTAERFPQFEKAIRRLVDQHLELRDEPLHLAISYDSPRKRQDIFLFEVIGKFASGEVSPDRELFETEFSSTSGFPMSEDQRLHLILTSPEEFEAALDDDWPSAREIVKAVRSGDSVVLHSDPVGRKLLKRIQATGSQVARAKRG